MVAVVGRLSFDVQGRGLLPNLDPFGQTEKWVVVVVVVGGGGVCVCKNWTFFMDVINVWSLMSLYHFVQSQFV